MGYDLRLSLYMGIITHALDGMRGQWHVLFCPFPRRHPTVLSRPRCGAAGVFFISPRQGAVSLIAMSSQTLTYDDLDPRDQALIDEAGGGNQTVVSARMVRALNGNGNAAIMLSQLLFWSRAKADEDGWFFRTQSNMEERCGLGPDAQRSAADTLSSLGLVETELRGMPARKHYRVRLGRVISALAGDEQDVGHGPDQDVGHDPEQDLGHSPQQDSGHGPEHRQENREEQRDSSGSGRAPASDDAPSGDSLPADAELAVTVELPEDYELYRPEIDALTEKYSPDTVDQLVRNQWGRDRKFSFHAISDMVEDHPWWYFVAGVVVTANEADRPNPRYLASTIDALINPNSYEQTDSETDRPGAWGDYA